MCILDPLSWSTLSCKSIPFRLLKGQYFGTWRTLPFCVLLFLAYYRCLDSLWFLLGLQMLRHYKDYCSHIHGGNQYTKQAGCHRMGSTLLIVLFIAQMLMAGRAIRQTTRKIPKGCVPYAAKLREKI